MKKLIAILLSLNFLLSTLGISLVVNYCPMKKGYTISTKEHKSCCCDDSSENDCCKSAKVIIQKIEAKYVASTSHFIYPNFEFTNHAFGSLILANHNPFVKEISIYKNLKPPKIPTSFTILYRTFLI